MANFRDIVSKVSGLGLYPKIGICLTILILVSVGYWQIFYIESSRIYQELVSSIEDTENQLAEQNRIAHNLGKYKDEVRLLDNKLSNVLRELPDKKEIETFLNSISVLAVDTGLEVLQFTPQGEFKDSFYARLPVKIQLEGTFHQLATFFDEVARLPRIVNINNISIQVLSANPNEVIIKADCVATAYRYLDDSEQRPTGKPKEAGKRA